uniref:Putative secreted protein n=1 Tax=Panstrongylus lignarius TaxID=156445 RepID=A0A224XS84_9HEMI
MLTCSTCSKFFAQYTLIMSLLLFVYSQVQSLSPALYILLSFFIRTLTNSSNNSLKNINSFHTVLTHNSTTTLSTIVHICTQSLSN